MANAVIDCMLERFNGTILVRDGGEPSKIMVALEEALSKDHSLKYTFPKFGIIVGDFEETTARPVS